MPSRLGLAVPLALGLALAQLKPTAISMLCCLPLIPVRHFGTRRLKTIYLGLHGLLGVFFWWLWNRPYLDLQIAQWIDPTHPSSTLMKAWFFNHPWAFLHPLAHAFSRDLWEQWPSFFGRVGGWIPPQFASWLAPLSLVFLVGYAGCGTWRAPADKGWAVGLLLQSLATFTLICLVLWLTFGTVGASSAPYFSGRYLFTVYLGLGLVWAELTHRWWPKARAPFFWLGLGANADWLGAIIVSTARVVLA